MESQHRALTYEHGLHAVTEEGTVYPRAQGQTGGRGSVWISSPSGETLIEVRETGEAAQGVLGAVKP